MDQMYSVKMQLLMVTVLLWVACGNGSVTINDPSDYVDLSSDIMDNSRLMDWNISATLYQTIAVKGPYYFSETEQAIEHRTFAATANDTSVVVVTKDSAVNVSNSLILKYGYASNIYQSSFYGVNAAVNVANGSSATFNKVNITTHNGSANLYSYGSGTYAIVEDSDLYSSGPVSHGLYAGGYGTVTGRNIRHYSGGYRSSAFSGDSPAGYVYIYDSVAHTAGIGSAIFYALGEIHAQNVVGHAEQSPVLFMDGVQTAELEKVDLTAGLLAGILLFSSSERETGAYVNLTNSKLTVLAETAPGLWFGNIIASVDLLSVEIDTASGVLVVANYSQVTQDFNYYGGYPDNNDLSPAEVDIHVSESCLDGDLVAYNGSSISWTLSQYSFWTGSVKSGYGNSSFGVYLDKTSKWILTHDAFLTNFTNDDPGLSNVISNGHNIYYDTASASNVWLRNKTIQLSGGGRLAPSTWREA
ncbi:hypothetical protein PISL3812_04881 [Talaromyces islandicus]|uniref:Uncharacterized protein n=1 Tax=Talaromyces islandicus TaxID=28573 RepID=A0A0U1LYW7_TALIS|nr:hypothetical protein PISL3812_04881 [Talaromyces islandicus]